MKIKLAVIVLAAGAAIGCSPSTPIANRPTDTIVIGIQTDIQTWNPFLAQDATNAEILDLIYPSLAIEQADYQLHPPTFEPALAERWEWSEDGRELTFFLREDAMWSDGVPVTSDDLLFSWQVQTSEELGWAWGDITSAIESVEAIDESTVRYRFTHRYPYQLMDVNDGPIVPAHAWSHVPLSDWEATDWEPLVRAAGPYTIDQHRRQQEAVLVRNPRYATPELPRIGRLVFRIVPSKNTLLTQFLAGGVDLMNGITPSDVARVQSDPGLSLTVFSDRSYTHVCWNLRRPVLADREVRRALAHAIDHEALIDVVYEGFARSSSGPVLSTMWAFNRDLEPPSFDTETAAAILSASGWSDSDGDGVLDREGQALSFELLAPVESETRQDVALMIERDLARLGIDVQPRFAEWGTVQAALDDGDFDAFVNRWIEPTQVDLRGVWHSAPPGTPTFNYGGYANPEVDRLLDAIAAEPDAADRKPLLDRVQELIVADQPYAFLVENVRIVGVNARVRNADINDASIFFNIEQWSLEESPGSR
jgi:peptide/nickel transport system substrate-binding protein